MKINAQPNFAGSFGIPPQMKEAEEKFQEEKARQASARPGASVDDASSFEFNADFEAPPVQAQEAAPEEITPASVLKKIGITLEEEDFQKIFFKGFIEKEISLFPGSSAQKPFLVTIKTLTGQEYDEVDELLADDIQDVKMTNDGYATRRNMWTLCFAVTHLAGKPVCKPVLKQATSGEAIDLKETAKKRRDVLSRMSGSVISKLMRTYATFSVAVNELIENPESDLLKKS